FCSCGLRPRDDDLLRVLVSVGAQVGQSLERRRAEARLRESEARKAAMLETALDAVITIDHHGRIVEWNPAAERTFGYPRGQAVGREMADLIVPPRLREQHHRGLAHFLSTGEGPVLGRRIELPALRADGGEFSCELA